MSRSEGEREERVAGRREFLAGVAGGALATVVSGLVVGGGCVSADDKGGAGGGAAGGGNEGGAQGGAGSPVLEVQAVPLKPAVLKTTGISEKTHQEHYKLYQGYVKKTNELWAKLKEVDAAKGNQVYSDIREVKVELTFAIGGVKNHEIYFDVLGGAGGKSEGTLAQLIERDFGTFDKWAADLKGTGMAARGWAWLAWDRDYRRLMNLIGDAQNTFPIWNAVPILALDTYEHAYYFDYQTNRAGYIDAFMANIDWNAVVARLDAAAK